MGLFVTSNVTSLNAQRNLANVTGNLNKSLERLSSGFRVNSASDGAADFLASEELRTQIRGAVVAQSNVQQGLAVLGIADGALQNIAEHVQRVREIAVAAANGTTTDFAAVEAERGQLVAAINNIATGTTFGQGAGQLVLLNNSVGNLNIQYGVNNGAVDQLDIGGAFGDAQAAALGIATAIASTANAQTVIGEADTALNNIATLQATMGGFVSQLENRADFLRVFEENHVAAEASIRNTDIARETSNLTRLQITQQAGASALAQANQLPQIALSLL